MALDLEGLLLNTKLYVKSDYSYVASITLFVALLCACIVIGHLLEENRWMNGSITALFLGLISGVVILFTTKGKSSRILVFSEDLFFIYLLPPIIFNAGQDVYNSAIDFSNWKAVSHLFYLRFQVKKKQFFRNFLTIMMFGVAGTLISFTIISFGAIGLFRRLNIGSLDLGDYLAIGAIFSATDSVCTLQVLNQDETPFLYSLVFGEGVVNDATSVVLFNAIQKFDLVHLDAVIVLRLFGNFFYLFFTSTILGAVAGLLSAYIIKKLYFGRHSTDREVSLMMLMAYLSYMIAQLLDLSSILTVFFCGIVMSHYTWHNVTESSRITTKHAFATLSFISEIFLFLYVGMDALDIEKWRFVSDSPLKQVSLSSLLLGLVLVGRAAFVFPLSFLSNLTKKSSAEKINFRQQVIIWWAGLMRGAVSIALAYNQFTRAGHTQLQSNAIMITSTITVVLFSTVVFGLLTKPLIRLLLPHPPKHLSSMSSDPLSPKSFLSRLLENGQGSEVEAAGDNVLFTKLSISVHRHWRRFDDSFMRPVFGGRGFVPFVPASPTEINGRVETIIDD